MVVDTEFIYRIPPLSVIGASVSFILLLFLGGMLRIKSRKFGIVAI